MPIYLLCAAILIQGLHLFTLLSAIHRVMWAFLIGLLSHLPNFLATSSKFLTVPTAGLNYDQSIMVCYYYALFPQFVINSYNVTYFPVNNNHE